jgi:hypothetical protein
MSFESHFFVFVDEVYDGQSFLYNLVVNCVSGGEIIYTVFNLRLFSRSSIMEWEIGVPGWRLNGYGTSESFIEVLMNSYEVLFSFPPALIKGSRLSNYDRSGCHNKTKPNLVWNGYFTPMSGKS